MIKKNQSLLNRLNALLDAVLLFIAYPLAIWIRFEVLNGTPSVNLLAPMYLRTAAILALGMALSYLLLHLYSPQRYHEIGKAIPTVLAVNAVGTLTLLAICYTIQMHDFTRMGAFLYWIVSSTLVSFKHIAVHALLQYWRKKGYNQKHVIVVGNGHLARQYMDDIAKNPQYGVTLDGYVSAVQKQGLGKCLGSYEKLEALLRKLNPDELVVALEPHETEFMKAIMFAADKEGTKVNIIPFFNDYLPPHATLDSIGNTKLINVRATPLDNLGWLAVKRTMDVFGALALIILTSPIMILTAIGVRLSSPGPILFRQKRVGLN